MLKNLLINLFLNFIAAYILSVVLCLAFLYNGYPQLVLLIVAGVFFILCALILSSVTVFLNLYEDVRCSMVLSLLSFFLLPGILSGWMLRGMTPDSKGDFSFYAITISVYFLVQIVFFIRFQKNMVSQ